MPDNRPIPPEIVTFTMQLGLPAKPQTWRPLGKSAYIVCPNGHGASLLDHKIAWDGNVSPSVVCPEDGCGFHAIIQFSEFGVHGGTPPDNRGLAISHDGQRRCLR